MSSRAYLAVPISLKCKPSFLKSVFDKSWSKVCHFLRWLISRTIEAFTASILEFKTGLSWRWGILDIITVLLFFLRDTLSIVCRISSLHCSVVCVSMLLVPAASTVTSLVGIFRISALIWRALLPGNTKPEASRSWPWTSGATPRTIELPTMATDTGWEADLSVRRRCCHTTRRWAIGGGRLGSASEGRGLSSRAAYLFLVTTGGTVASWWGMGGPGGGHDDSGMPDGADDILGSSLMVWMSFCNSEFWSLTLAIFCFKFPFSVLRRLISLIKPLLFLQTSSTSLMV